MKDRLNPSSKGNARLLFIDGDKLACDICDEKYIGAVIESLGGITTIHICKKCLKEILKRFDE